VSVPKRVVILGVLLLLALAPAADAATRHYWVSADPVTWNIVPSGRDPISGNTFAPESTTMQTVLYKKYTRNFASLAPNTGLTGDNDGIPGPTIRARVGDTVIVHFRNNDTRFNRPHSMHFHGFFYEFRSDGSFIPGVTGSAANVQPGQTATYRLIAKRSSVGVWPYHDHSSSMMESIAGGMYGAIVIRGRRERAPHRQNLVFFGEHIGFNTVNGRAFVGNTPTFRARINETVEWQVLALGNEHHTFHLHGHRWRHAGEFIDTRNVGPAESFRFRIKEDVAGSWLYHCHVETHQVSGMIGIYRVAGRARASALASLAGRL
jgi:FtsP/CotA-like multicopper oxidase with cupredoxin domain